MWIVLSPEFYILWALFMLAMVWPFMTGGAIVSYTNMFFRTIWVSSEETFDNDPGDNTIQFAVDG